MTEGLEQWKEEHPDLFEKTIQGIPLGRFADPEKDIGRVCVFLASDEASYVTGETITQNLLTLLNMGKLLSYKRR